MALAAGCSNIDRTHGYVPPDSDLNQLVIGVDTRETVAEVIEVDQRRLLGLSEVEAEPEPERNEVCTIRTRRGSEVIVSQIPCTN